MEDTNQFWLETKQNFEKAHTENQETHFLLFQVVFTISPNRHKERY